MPLFPDLNACGIAFMQFSMHAAGGWKEIDDFWAQHGLEEGDERLLFSGYTRNGKPHTVWIRWDRSHRRCCDVWIGLEADLPSRIWPKRSSVTYRLRQSILKDFLSLLAAKFAPLSVATRYGFRWDKRLDTMLHLPAGVRPKSLSLEVYDEREQRVMNVTYENDGGNWLAIVAPVGRFQIHDAPVTDDFFKAPYNTACLLAKSLRQERLEPVNEE